MVPVVHRGGVFGRCAPSTELRATSPGPCGIIGRRRFFLQAVGSRRTSEETMTRFFAARASARVSGARCALSLPANSLRLRAGGAWPVHSASDALCRSRDAPPRLPPLGFAALHSSERRACRTSQSRSTARRLKPTISRLRTPSIGSIPAFRLGRLRVINLLLSTTTQF
jgi:hypothetical protein